MLSKNERIYTLDVLRGVAAIGVVFWHWRMLWAGKIYSVETLPLYDFFFIFYEKGWLAVDLFFMLSGFIFSWLYAEAISERIVNAKEYVILRFSRLYPLHLVTLLLVLVCQTSFFIQHEKFYIYDHNDVYHFFLNVFFLSSWGFEQGLSFNAPIWSVSVEVFLYGLFFITAFYLPHPSKRFITWVALAFTGYFFITSIYVPLGRGVGSFFLGACLHPVFIYLSNLKFSRLISFCIIGITIISWIIILMIYMGGFNFDYWFYQVISKHYPVKILFPFTILSLLIVEPHLKIFVSRISWLGDISYATYLLHFPIQILFVLVFNFFGLQLLEDYVLFIYLTFVVVGALLSFNYFERPAQRFLRNSLCVNKFFGVR